MPSRNTESTLRAAVSVTQMAKMVGLSRASFYEHVRRGHFVAPAYQGESRRPLYTADMQRQNLEVRATQMGVNGEFVLFYERQPRDEGERLTRRSRATVAAGGASGDLLRALEGLGLQGLTEAAVAQAVASCFPRGTSGIAAGEVVRVVYRHLRRSDRA